MQRLFRTSRTQLKRESSYQQKQDKDYLKFHPKKTVSASKSKDKKSAEQNYFPVDNEISCGHLSRSMLVFLIILGGTQLLCETNPILFAEAAKPRAYGRRGPRFDEEVKPEDARNPAEDSSQQIAKKLNQPGRVNITGQSKKAAVYKETIVKTLQNLAAVKETRCKINSILEEDDFGLDVIFRSSAEQAKEHKFLEYDRYTKRVKIVSDEIAKSGFESFIRHEAHHAYVNQQNRFNGRIFFDAKGKRDPNSTPCFPSPHSIGKLDCTKIVKIQEQGFAKVEEVLKLFEMSNAKQPLSDQQKSLFDSYMRFSQNYQPLIIDVEVTVENLNKNINNGLFNKNTLKVMDEKKFLDVHDDNGFQRYAYEIEKRGNKYFAKTLTAPRSQMYRLPLRDLQYMASGYEKGSVAYADRIKEKDAVIHQLFEPHPELLDLLFPGLRQYHLDRSADSYKKCVVL